MLSHDGWGGLAVLATSLLLFMLTIGLQGNPMVPIGPGFYPRIVLGLTALLALALVVADLLAMRGRRPARASTPAAPSSLNYAMVVAMFAVFGAYCLLLPYLGFRVATLVYVATVNAMLAPPPGMRGWVRVATVALVTTTVTYFIFERYLLVLLPRGLWTGF